MTILDTEFVGQLLEDLTPGEFRLVAGTFGRDLDQILGAMAGAAAASDRDGFARHAHRLAGAAGAVGAEALRRALRALATPDPARDDAAALPGLRALGQDTLAALAAAQPPDRPAPGALPRAG